MVFRICYEIEITRFANLIAIDYILYVWLCSFCMLYILTDPCWLENLIMNNDRAMNLTIKIKVYYNICVQTSYENVRI